MLKSFVGLSGSGSQFSFPAVPAIADGAMLKVTLAGGVSPVVVTNCARSLTALGVTTFVVGSQAPVARRLSDTAVTLGRYVELSGKSGRVIVNPAAGGSWIWNPPGSVEDRQLAGAGAAQTPGFLTVTSRGPVCWGLAGMLTVSVIVVPSGDTLGLVVGVMSPAGPPKLSVAPDRNRLPPSVSWTCLAAPTFVVTLPGRTAASAGVVIVKGTALLRTPLTATVTLPFTACVGTVTATDDEVAAVTVAVTLVPLVPAKVTDGVPLKPEPLIVTLLPIGPALVDRLL